MRSKSEFFQNLCRKFSGRVAAIDEFPKLQGASELISEAEEARVRILTYLAFHRMSFSQKDRVMRALFELSDAETWVRVARLSKSTGELFRHILFYSESAHFRTLNSDMKSKENATKSVKRTYLIGCENVCYKHPVVCSALAQKKEEEKPN